MSHNKDRRLRTQYHNKHISKSEQFLQIESDTEKSHEYMYVKNVIVTEVK